MDRLYVVMLIQRVFVKVEVFCLCKYMFLKYRYEKRILISEKLDFLK